MCELFAMVSRVPTRVTFSFAAFTRRGGLDGPHRDGWGVGFHDGVDAMVVRETAPACESPHAAFLAERGRPSSIVLSHVRLATHGDRRLANTQPFRRELGGRVHLFAHNGHVPGVQDDPRFAFRRHHPLGTTDSEHVFCSLLERLEALYLDAELVGLAPRLEVVSELAAEMRAHGPANFVYTDGDAVFVHADRRTQASGAVEPPGLFALDRSCAIDRDALDGVTIASTPSDAPPQRLVLVASRPLSDDEAWEPLEQGTVLAIRAGERIG